LHGHEISFALKIDGISTEADTWKGLEILRINLSQLTGSALVSISVKRW